jgi:hypothetical protein
MSDFKKNDQNKPKLSMLPVKSKAEIARVLEFGANKYGRDNWRKCTDTNRYIDAALRHIDAYIDGEKLDPESGHNHLAHAICSLMFILEVENG